MSKAIPFGKSEDDKLEFKGRDSRPIDIAREVVAFLNAGGGELWWGVGESVGRASRAEPFTDGDARKRDLQNHIIDTLEPSPRIPDEVRIDLVPANQAGEAGDVICIQVKKPGRGRVPFAQMKDQGRRYWVRTGDRIAIMSREDIRQRFAQGAGAGQDGDQGIEKKIRVERERVQQDAHQKNESLFWMIIHPVPELDDEEFNIGDKKLEDLLRDPAASGNRSNGWNFIRELSMPRLSQRGLRQADQTGIIEIRTNGAIAFSTPIEQLHWKGDPREIWPFALLEYPVSIMRLAAKVFGQWGRHVSEALVDYVFVGLAGWTLRGGSPRSPSGRYHHAKPFEGNDDLFPAKLFRFSLDDLVTEPDRCGRRLMPEIYRAFGHGEEAIPPEFDSKTGTLIILG